MPLSQKSTSFVRLPKKGQNLLPAIAMLPKEHSSQLLQNLGLKQKQIIDKIKMERQEAPITDVSRPHLTYFSQNRPYKKRMSTHVFDSS